ncbi:peroxisome biogenesis factor 10-like [Plakobranchus ocellatus]|uniref:RING-type E3 ubiquitin transferase n=1 Tax=Plakobranchus ocellatus TaxID=259542 RepID=A0AAV4DQ67_9GAST|nr:peroxisome biogenesis factor 10-like [Plakobranchus ocellatus]
MFRPAGTAEIIRSHQKDDNFLNSLRTAVADIAQRIAGPRVWLEWRRTLDVCADVTYLLLTTCSDLQTVGEEYVNIIMTDGTLRALPSRWRRALMTVMQVCAPYILHSSLLKLEHLLQSSTSVNLTPAARETLLNVLPLIRRAVTVLHRCHLAMFYVHGIFYHIAKRLTGIHYIQYMTRNTSASTLRPFQILGYLSLLQLASSFLVQLGYLILALRSQGGSQNSSETHSYVEADTSGMNIPANEKCPLCLGQRRQSTLTPCGHLYCWRCIHEWCVAKQECPLCRDQFPVSRLIALQNFDAVGER